MKKVHETTRHAGRVREPVQVYLDRADRSRLDRLAHQLDATKSDILRQGLEALERTLSDPAAHPALRIIGIADHETAPPVGYDVARDHDRYFADLEDARPRSKRRRRGA